MTTYLRDDEGKFIPATQRPDGTWRKARRVKDGYIPQEEVPLYESKGKLFAKKPDIPVGMCPIIAKESKERREKQSKKKQINPVPGIIVLPQQQNNSAIKTVIKDTSLPPSKDTDTGRESKLQHEEEMEKITESVSTISFDDTNKQDIAKKLKKLRKKIHEIDIIEAKLKSGELKKPDKDQLDKVKRKEQILKEISDIEEQNK